MIGAICGDMIGSPYEFDRGDKTKDFPLFSSRSHFTDDSVMTIAVAVALISSYGKSDDEIRTALVDSMQKWGKRYPNAGYGGMFRHWLSSKKPKPYGSFGNGSAMRVSSVGWLYDDIDTTRKMAALTAEVTHNHPEGIKGAEATASAIFLARTGHSKDDIYCPKHSITTNNVFDYLCKLDDEKYSKGEELTQDAINDYNSQSKMQEEIKEAKRILAEMEQKGIISFKDALRFHIKRLGLHRKDIWDQIYLGESTFKSYCDRGSEPSLENALIICNKLSLPYLLSINLLERVHITLNTAEKRDQMYDYLLTITNATLDEWELFLTKYGFPSLVNQSN